MPEHGLVLGKFMPPHRGHLYLIDFARQVTPDLTVVVGSLPHEPIPGALRHAWLKELYPDLHVVHLTDENPQLPEEHPDFWNIWRTSLQRIAGRPIDLLFAGEPYGEQLAQTLDARFVPCNAGRDLLAVSGTAVRDSPEAHWHLLPPVVQAYYARRVLIFGPESTGKTTLAQRLAQEFDGTYVPEYARTYLDGKEDHFDLHDMTLIARGQNASEQALARVGKPWLFCDTDALTTQIWSQELFGQVARTFPDIPDHYDLVLLTDVDVPWVPGSLRLRPEGRVEFLARCRAALEERGRTYKVISGGWEERWSQAKAAVQAVKTSPRRP